MELKRGEFKMVAEKGGVEKRGGLNREKERGS